jgi:hypothetical protein
MERTGTAPKARKMIGLNFQTKSFLKTSVFGVYTRILHNTLVNITNEYMGFQSALYNPTVVKEPLKALVNEWFVHKGVYHNPS